jgi:hypothetical protein
MILAHLNAATTGISFDNAGKTSRMSSDDKSSSVEDDDNSSKVGVLFLNLGGPATGDDVEGEL